MSVERNPNFRRWFGNSQVVDGRGRPLVVYHGTPDARFEQFQEEAFFSADPAYASKFTTSACASSSFYGVTDEAPAVFPVFLKIERPFDTRRPEHRRLYEERYHLKFGNGAALTERGLPDWVEARDLAEFLREEIPEYGFDGLYVDEGCDSAGQRPMAYIVFEPTQIKSAIGNSGAFDPNDPDITDSAARERIRQRAFRNATSDRDEEYGL